MRKYIFVIFGGALGAMARTFIKNIELNAYVNGIPLDTLLINVLGSFVLSFFLTITLKSTKITHDIRSGVSAGFLGAFTTFSAICGESVALIYNGNIFAAITYICISVVFGLSAAGFGYFLAQKLAKTKNDVPIDSARVRFDEDE